ncbi:MAG: hypothetical protein WCT08_06150 [Patescibacteria group bacterium]|jgi:hypothetical protein
MIYKSRILSGAGTGFEVLKALIDGIVARGGSDDDLRRILKEKNITDAICGILVDNRRFFTFIVDFDQKCWKRFPTKENYQHVNSDLEFDQFPIRFSGSLEVTVELIPCEKGMNIEKHLSICKEQKALEIDRPISETFFKQFPEELEKDYICSVCGVRFEKNGKQVVSLMEADKDGLAFSFLNTDYILSDSKFLVLREVKPLLSV